MSAIERAEQDVADGDLGMARQRLESYLQTQGYCDDVLRRLGRICQDMKDPCAAGRFWLLSGEDSPEARQAIELFIRRAQANPGQVFSQLPSNVLTVPKEKFPDVVRTRLEHYDLAERFDTRRKRHARNRTGTARWSDKLISAVLTAMAVLMFISLIVGVITVFRWLLSLLW